MSYVSQTFSDLWYRVADFRPRLSHHLMVRRQTYRHETWFLIGDPASSKFYRFNASAYRFLGLLDGTRTVQEAWDVCNAQLGDDAPTQTDAINLLAQLQLFGLLRNDLPIDPDRLRERIDQIREQRHAERVGGYVFYTIPIVNPERFLAKYANVARAVFSGKGFLLLLILLAIALGKIIPRWDELWSSGNSVISPDNLFVFTICLFLLKVIHEYAHGFACKAYGGRVTEIGVFMMMVLPLPYCDATASWAFPSKWHRIFVGAAGMMVEVSIACVAAIVWADTSPGLLHTVSYNIMFIASVITIVFNMNPLLRYDGYYILADLLEIPNLAPRSQELLKYLTRRYLFGLKGETPPAITGRSEGAWMILHAVLAFPYRLLVVVGIVLFVSKSYFILGFLIGVFGGIMWLLVPVFKGLSYVISDPAIQVVRQRAVGVTFGGIASVVIFLGFIPMPNHVWGTGVIEPTEIVTYRAANNGYLRDVTVHDGQFVKKGTPILRLFNPIMEGDYRKSLAKVQTEKIRLTAATASTPVDRRLAEPLYDNAVVQYKAVAHLLGEMNVRAEFSGRIIAPEISTKIGSFVQKGSALCTLATVDDLLIRAYIPDSSFALLVGSDHLGQVKPESSEQEEAKLLSAVDASAKVIEAKIYGLAGRTYTLQPERVMPAGVRTIRHPSLGHVVKGGRIAIDPSDTKRQSTINPQWEMTLRFIDLDLSGERRTHHWMPDAEVEDENNNREIEDNGDTHVSGGIALPGTRVKVRFTLDSQPLALQWWRTLRQAFIVRFGL